MPATGCPVVSFSFRQIASDALVITNPVDGCRE
jgi:hypothetical protein